MRLSIIAIGRLMDGPERDLCARYQERATGLSRSLGFTGPDIVELAESRGRRSEERRNEEARLIAERLPQGLVIALDERGKNLGSEAFAGKIAAARDAGTPAATLLIGGADGLAEELRARAGLVLCFGALTIPHQIVRALALEQLYRAMTIMAGHPYHRA